MKELDDKMPVDKRDEWIKFKSRVRTVCFPATDQSKVNITFKSKKVDKNSNTKLTLFYDGQIKRETIKYTNRKDNISYSRVEENDKLSYEKLKTKDGVQLEQLSIEEPLEKAVSCSRCFNF